MFNAFQAQPYDQPYDALPANVDLNAVNTAWNRTARLRKKWTSQEDARTTPAEPDYLSIGARPASVMPAPTPGGICARQPKKDYD